MTKLKNFIKNYKTKIITDYLKKNHFFLIFNVFTNKTKNFNKKFAVFRLNNLTKIKMLVSVKKIIFFNNVKNSIFLICFKNIEFFKNLIKLSFLHFSVVNFNTKVYLFTILKNMNSFHYLQNKLLVFKHFILYLKLSKQ